MSEELRYKPRHTSNNNADVHVSVTAEHHIPLARHAAADLIDTMGFDSIHKAALLTAISELAGNLFFHTSNGGTLTFRPLRDVKAFGLEIIVSDEGPGIANLEEAMRDGFSTGGGLGGGLPGVRRLMDEFHIESRMGRGTFVRVVKWQSHK